VPRGSLRLPIASGEGPAPTITISDDDWQRIEPVAWARCETVSAAEVESLNTVLDAWMVPKQKPE
jgi:hypothetical protein